MKPATISTILSRLFFIGGLILGALLIGGFFKFADESVKSQKHADNLSADGIVSLTGGSRNRLTEAVKLLERGAGKKLLISGVFKGATAEELRQVSGGSRQIYDCCVDIGRKAHDTIGNAVEIEEWVKKNNYKSIILVTDSYHMPRSKLEASNKIKNLKIIPYPVRVAPYDDPNWWENEKVLRGLINEYSKFRMAQLRIALHIELKDKK